MTRVPSVPEQSLPQYHDQGANTLIVNDGQIYVSTGP